MSFKKMVFGEIIVLSAILFFAGCTPEKAGALLTAIKSFESKSLQAIGVYEQLFKDYSKQERETNDHIFEQSSAAIIKYGLGAVTVDDMISVLSLRQDAQADRTIEKEFYEIKAVYISLRNAYESLPKGRILGAKYVGCGQDVIAKATNQLINFSINVSTDPLYPIALRKKVAYYKKLVANNKKKEARLVFNEIAATIVKYDEKHEEAIKLTLAAVEDGIKVHQLLGKYSDISVSDILGVVQFGLNFLGTLQGVNVTEATAKLADIQKELGEKEYWQRIESTPIAKIENCIIKSIDK